MADDIGFSGPGKPDISNPRGGGTQVAVPEFFVRDAKIPEDKLSLGDTVETPREKAARLDAIQDIGVAENTAPKL